MDLLGLAYFKPILFGNDEGEFNVVEIPVNVNITSAVFLDYNNSGWKDLYMLSDEESIFFKKRRFSPSRSGFRNRIQLCARCYGRRLYR